MFRLRQTDAQILACEMPQLHRKALRLSYVRDPHRNVPSEALRARWRVQRFAIR
jgi:hypothetical protein